MAEDISRTGGMIAAMPSPMAASVLTVDGGMRSEDLHVTLAFLGSDVSELSSEERLAATMAAREGAQISDPLLAWVAGYGVLGTEEPPATVLFLNSASLPMMHAQTMTALDALSGGIFPEQHMPWIPHITLGYGLPVEKVRHLVGTLIPLDRVELHWAGSIESFGLSGASPYSSDQECDPEMESCPASVLASAEVLDEDTALEALTAATVADRGRSWDGNGARRRILEHCSNEQGEVNVSCARKGFLLKVPDADPNTQAAWKLPYMDVVDGQMVIVPRGVAALAGGRGVGAVKGISDEQRKSLERRVCSLYAQVRRSIKDWPECPFSEKSEKKETRTPSSSRSMDRTPSPSRSTGRSVYSSQTASGDEDVTAAVVGKGFNRLPVAAAEREWNGRLARARVLDFCKNQIGEGPTAKEIDPACAQRAFLLRRDDQPAHVRTAWSLPFADVIDGRIQIVPRGVKALASGHGVHGVQGVSAADRDRLENLTCALYAKMKQSVPDFPDCPFEKRSQTASTEVDMEDIQAAVISASDSTVPRGRYNVPFYPPENWFEATPQKSPIPITITQDGRVFGHIFEWNACHSGFPDRCVPPPRSMNDYQDFHRGGVLTREGSIVAVGHLTVGGGHAAHGISMKAAVAHYDDATTTGAVVQVHEDEWGGFVAGSLVPDVTEEQIAMLLRSPMSGDWRRSTEGHLELIAAHGVNVPGYGVNRPRKESMVLSASVEQSELDHVLIIGPSPVTDILEERVSLAASALGIDVHGRLHEAAQKLGLGGD